MAWLQLLTLSFWYLFVFSSLLWLNMKCVHPRFAEQLFYGTSSKVISCLVLWLHHSCPETLAPWPTTDYIEGVSLHSQSLPPITRLLPHPPSPPPHSLLRPTSYSILCSCFYFSRIFLPWKYLQVSWKSTLWIKCAFCSDSIYFVNLVWGALTLHFNAGASFCTALSAG